MKFLRRKNSGFFALTFFTSASISIPVTRFFLFCTGNPSIQKGEIHVSHVIFGGFFMFLALFLVLIFGNKKIYFWCSLIGGIGLGFFVDQLGKFITVNYDYWYEPAAPIIYVLFIMFFLLIKFFTREKKQNDIEKAYNTLEYIIDFLDDEIDEKEKKRILELIKLRKKQISEKNALAIIKGVEKILSDKTLEVPEEKAISLGERFIFKLRKIRYKITKKRMYIWILESIVILRSILILIQSSQFIFYKEWKKMDVSRSYMTFLFLFTTSQIIVGTLFLIGTFLVFSKKGNKKLGLKTCKYGVFVSLFITDIFHFYYDQFSSVLYVIFDLLFLDLIFAQERDIARYE